MKRLTALLLTTLFTLSVVVPIAAAQSQTNWLTAESVFDITGNASLQPNQPFLTGHTYNVTMKVAVPFSQSSTFSLALNSLLSPSGAQYWYVKTPSYGGYNASNFSPGSTQITFKQVNGSVVVSVIFGIPLSLTLVTSPGNFTRHLAVDNFAYVTASVSGGAQVGTLAATVEDQTIQTYLTTYQQKSTLISSGQIDSSYSTVVSGILTQAQSLYTLGLPDQGTSLLNTIVPSSFPAPPSSSMSTALLAGVVVAAVIIVVLIVLMIRGRGKQGFASGVVSEVQKELAVLEVTAAKYDRALADRLKAVRDKLGETD